jgi:polyhydroxyalkanoate synthesis regulator phasin
MNKKLAGTGLAIGLVAGAGAGLIIELAGNAGAASNTPAAIAVGDSTADTTATSDTTATTDTSGTTDAPDTNRPDPTTKLQEVLKPLVDDGTITQDQADKVIAAIVAARPAGFPHGGGPFGGHRGPGGLGGVIGAGLDTVATTLGISADEVKTALESGQTLADLAVAHGKTAQDVIDAIVAEAKTHLDTAVTDGKLTQAQADKILTELTTRTTDFVNKGFPAGLPGLGGHGFGRHFGDDDGTGDNGSGDDGSGDTTATTAPATTAGN